MMTLQITIHLRTQQPLLFVSGPTEKLQAAHQPQLTTPQMVLVHTLAPFQPTRRVQVHRVIADAIAHP